MLGKWKYHKGMYRCPTKQCQYLATRDYIIANGIRTVHGMNLECPRCRQINLIGYFGEGKEWTNA